MRKMKVALIRVTIPIARGAQRCADIWRADAPWRSAALRQRAGTARASP